jgi:hypothetical protein
MKIITVSAATYHAVMDLALTDPEIFPNFKTASERLEDGNWAIPLSKEVHDRLRKIRSEDESDDDAIQKLIRFYRKHGLN